MRGKRILAIAMVTAGVIGIAAWRWLPRLREPTTALPQQQLDPEYAKFQGTWKFASMEVEGVQKPEEDFKKFTVILTNDQWIVLEGTNIKADTAMELDPTADPKTIDLLPYGETRVIRGIYRIDQDTFTMCDRGSDRGERPTVFETKPDSGLVLVVLKRTTKQE